MSVFMGLFLWKGGWFNVKFVKNFNNNAALVESSDNVEWVVIGNGIGFGYHVGDKIDDAKIDRRFKAEEDSDTMKLVSGFDAQVLEVASALVNVVEPLINVKFDDVQFLVLVDHLQYSLKKNSEEMFLNDQSVHWEIKKLFPIEFNAAEAGIQKIESEFNLSVQKNELILLTYHLINVKEGGHAVQDSMKMSELISGIINIIQLDTGIILDEKTFNYSRFVSHLRYLFIRHFNNTEIDRAELDPELLAMMISRYPQVYKTVEKIVHYIRERANWDLQADEQVYLVLHIWRVTHRQEEN